MTAHLRIVMPVLNEAGSNSKLRDSLQALQPLRERGAELIVVDGGGTDNTWALARVHADQVLLAPRGRAAQAMEIKKPTYWNASNHSKTSAYSLTSPQPKSH